MTGPPRWGFSRTTSVGTAPRGGGDYALLSHCVLCAERDDGSSLREVLEEARGAENVEVQVYALDALSRIAAESGDLEDARALLSESDGLAAQVAHVVDESDRFDATAARAIV